MSSSMLWDYIMSNPDLTAMTM
ncbi:unnamed protein product [Staurois parvus]|uniref:Cytochrome oxidase subunit II n=1 Tax=Staurois parvus TaxID=386267 RepID=A0ABN9G6R1_9NEOB|nr:unnamed protein product [Staurois parvus]